MVVDVEDVRAHLLEKHKTIAADDIATLAGRRDEVLDKAKMYENGHPHITERIALATDLLDDHSAGECPQIPFYSVSLVAVAVFYVLQDIDAIPDFLPGGFDDDDLMLREAFVLARPGLERYCDFKDIGMAVLDACSS